MMEWNGNTIKKRYRNAVKAGVTLASLKTETHIKVEYQRPVTGKGFTDITGALRQSITEKVIDDRKNIIGIVFAGMDYGPHVEHVAGGKYAYMLPGFLEVRGQILGWIIKGAKTALG